MTGKQREYLTKYLSDVSKGTLLAVVIGVGTGKLSLGYIVLMLLGAVLTFAWGYLLEGRTDAT
jgi:hypothetical protein